jgi:hypothetical protein
MEPKSTSKHKPQLYHNLLKETLGLNDVDPREAYVVGSGSERSWSLSLGNFIFECLNQMHSKPKRTQ